MKHVYMSGYNKLQKLRKNQYNKMYYIQNVVTGIYYVTYLQING